MVDGSPATMERSETRQAETDRPDGGANRPAEAGAGTWFHNPASGEIARLRVGPGDTDGRRIEVDLWLQPGAAVAAPHVHAQLVERFEVLAGEVAFRIGDAERRVRGGDGVAEVAPKTVHDWWNAGDEIAQVRVEVEAAPGAPGRPASRFVAVIEVLWSLGALGRVNAKSMPDPLWLAALGREYRDAIQFIRPPAVVQAAVFAPLAALARQRGRDPLAPELHGPWAPCVIADPGEDGLARLLERPVQTRAARGRG